MPMWFQHLLVLLIVAVCALFACRRVLRTVRGGKRGAGGCGCESCPAGKPPSQEATRVVFMPVEMLQSRRHL